MKSIILQKIIKGVVKYLEAKHKEHDGTNRFPLYLEAFELLKEKIENVENTTFQTFLDKIKNKKKS
jgi:hypothetical protein